jgi:cytosine/adenosine deaminase-related metal-dependent hydrolase
MVRAVRRRHGSYRWACVFALAIGSAPLACAQDDGSADGTTGDPTDGGTEPEPDPGEVVECDAFPIAPAASGTCEVTSAGSGGFRLRGTVLTPEGVLRGGEVLVREDGTIACVDCDCSAAVGDANPTIVACADGVISPGLVNPHEHITYANNRPMTDAGERYEHRHDWRTGADGHTEVRYDGDASEAQVLAAELRFVMSGATSLAGAGGAGGLLRNLDLASGLEGLARSPAELDTFPLDDIDGTKREMGCNYGGSPTTAASIEGVPAYLPHIAEGIDLAAANEFVCTTTGGENIVGPRTAIIHAVGLDARDIGYIEQSGAMVVWSPRSNIALYGDTAMVTAMDAMGVPLALGTDWLLSGSMNMLRELHCADELNRQHFGGHFTDRQIWEMATINGALATGFEGALGSLRPGLVADLAIYRATEEGTDHRAVLDAMPGDVVLVMRGGEVLYGDGALLEGIGAAECEAIDVCGVGKRVCVSRDTDGRHTLAALQAAASPFAPLFACEEPDPEPTCVPRRATYSSAITEGDRDGDGVGDDEDLCASVFDPIRAPETTQADADGDAIGDACDPCPLVSGEECGALSARDIDDDGVENGADNCPRIANADQADGDGDGSGDACDTCAVATFAGGACPTSIAALRDPSHPDHPAPGTSVAIAGAWVTAVRPASGDPGFFVQDDSGEPYSGILVFTAGGSPTVEVGDRVTVSGTYDEYFDVSEIVASSVVIDEAGATLPVAPVMVEPADVGNGGAMAEAYESMLVSVRDVAITNANPDDPDDYDEIEIDGALRVDDALSDGQTGSGFGNDCPVGSTFTEIVGVLAFSFDDRKLWPRSAADVSAVECDPFQ